MTDTLANSLYFGAAVTVTAYALGLWVKKRLKKSIFNPILIAAGLIILLLLILKIDYSAYYASAKYISYLLTPATVCLAIPLYEQLALLKRNYRAILLGILAGVLASLGSVCLMALILGLSRAEYITLLPKSVTTAIGLPLSEALGGFGSITAISIILTGVVGNVAAEGFLKRIHITDPVAKGVAIGTAAHAFGTTKALEMGEIEGAMSSLSIVVAGLMTVIGASVFVNFI